MRISVRSITNGFLVHPLFKGLQRHTKYHRICGTLPATQPYLWAIQFHGQVLDTVKKKRELFLGDAISIGDFQYVLPLATVIGIGILTHFPFKEFMVFVDFLQSSMYVSIQLRYNLGPANSCPTAVSMKTFSTSVFKDLIWILATTTKICSRGRFMQAHA